MEIITGTADFYINDETAVAIGKFDGVHIGHQALLDEILKQKENGKKHAYSHSTLHRLFSSVTVRKNSSPPERKREKSLNVWELIF